MFAKKQYKRMNRASYTNKVKRQLARRKITLNDEQLKQLVDDNIEKRPPSKAAQRVSSVLGTRSEKRQKAAEAFAPVLEACLEAFDASVDDKDKDTSDNWRDLRSIACHIALDILNLRPASAMVAPLGLKSSASVYHMSYRAKSLLAEKRVVFCDKFNRITKKLKL